MSSHSIIAKPLKFSWKCKQCRHYNSGHSAKCSSCIKYTGTGTNSTLSNNNNCTSNTNFEKTSLDNRVDLATITPVEEVETSVIIDNSIYFIENRGNISNSNNSDPLLSPKRLNPSSFVNGQSPNKVCKSLEKQSVSLLSTEQIHSSLNDNQFVFSQNQNNLNANIIKDNSWACQTCTLKNPIDHIFCSACYTEKYSENFAEKVESSGNATNSNSNERPSKDASKKICNEPSNNLNINSIAKFVVNKFSPHTSPKGRISSQKKSPMKMSTSSSRKSPNMLDFQDNSKDQEETYALAEMWTCSKCSFGYNPTWCESCDICQNSKDKSKIRQVLEQKLDADFQILTPNIIEDIPSPEQSWKCIKCTLVNSGSENACKVCGGSRLKSICYVDSATLKKGQFWDCIVCTLKNPLFARRCKACKAKVDGTGGTKDKMSMANNPKTTENEDKVSSKSKIKDRGEGPDPSATNGYEGEKVAQRTADQTNLACKGAIPKSVSVPFTSSDLTFPSLSMTSSTSFSHCQQESERNKQKVCQKSSPKQKQRSSQSHWRCSACTFDNSPTAISCKMCGSLPCVDDLIPSWTDSRPRTGGQSELMDVLREIEEQEALDKWNKIVAYCKEVSL